MYNFLALLSGCERNDPDMKEHNSQTYHKTCGYDKIKSMLVKLFEGMKSITTMKKPLLFIFYTISIWGIYFLMFYIGKLFFPFDIELGILPLLSGFVMGTLGILAPVQGGIGAWHFMVIEGLAIYGVTWYFTLVRSGLLRTPPASGAGLHEQASAARRRRSKDVTDAEGWELFDAGDGLARVAKYARPPGLCQAL